MCFCYDSLVGKGVWGLGERFGWLGGLWVLEGGGVGKVIFLRTENRNCRKKGLKSGSKDAKKATGRLWF